MVCEQLFGEYVVGITTTNLGEDGLMVEGVRLGARSRLEVVCDASCGGEGTFAEGTGDGGTAVDVGA